MCKSANETHHKGENLTGVFAQQRDKIAVDTYGGRVHVEWDHNATVTPLGQLSFFIVLFVGVG